MRITTRICWTPCFDCALAFFATGCDGTLKFAMAGSVISTTIKGRSISFTPTTKPGKSKAAYVYCRRLAQRCSRSFFWDTVPDAVHLSAPTIWECTRFCVDDKILDRGQQDELVFTSGVLIAALGGVAIRAGIELVVGNFDADNAPAIPACRMRG